MNQDNFTKECIQCHKTKPLSKFYFRKDNHSYRPSCKLCRIIQTQQQYWKNPEKKKQYVKQWRMHHPDYEKQRYQKNPIKKNSSSKRWRLNNPEKVKQSRRESWKKNKKRNNEHKKSRYHNDIDFYIYTICRTRLNKALTINQKTGRTIEILGCSIFELRKYLESMFTNKITWKNRGFGKDKWNIDHIIPLSFFNLQDPTEQKQACHYTNLQPMMQDDNLQKGDRINGLKLLYRNNTPFI